MSWWCLRGKVTYLTFSSLLIGQPHLLYSSRASATFLTCEWTWVTLATGKTVGHRRREDKRWLKKRLPTTWLRVCPLNRSVTSSHTILNWSTGGGKWVFGHGLCRSVNKSGLVEHPSHQYRVWFVYLLWTTEQTRTKENTYQWVSVQWKTTN